jgi:hypothetical protein
MKIYKHQQEQFKEKLSGRIEIDESYFEASV